MRMPKPVKLPGLKSPGSGGTPPGMTKPANMGFGLGRKLRKGSEFQGGSPADMGVGDQMSDYARVIAAKGGM